MKTIARVEGFAGSIMSVIIMACDEIWLSSVAMLMIHGPSTTAEGTEEMLLETAKGLKNLKEASVNAYKTRFRGTDEELRKMLQKDTWLYPQECLELGFCDKILEKEYTQCLEFDQIKSLVDENRDLQSQITSLTQQLLDTPKTTKQQINEYFGG